MGGSKGSQQAERAPDHGNGSSGEPADNREAASSPQDVVLVAAYSSEDGDHDHDHDQVPPTPPICQSGQALPQPPAAGCSEERATPTTAAAAAQHAANGINSGESSPGAAAVVLASAAAHHDHPPTPGASPSAASLSADAAGVTNKEGEDEGDRSVTKTAETELPTPNNNNNNNNNDNDIGSGAGTGNRSHDGRVSVLCRFRRTLDREGERGSSRERAKASGSGSGSGSDWLSFGSEVEHDGGEGGAGTVSVRMGGVWSRRGFDKVFKPGVEQVEVYNEVKRVAHGVSQGFNGTIFAYGQTGSGKTYTMGGSTDKLFFTAAPTPRPPSLLAADFEGATTTTTMDGVSGEPSAPPCAATTPTTPAENPTSSCSTTGSSSSCALSPAPSPTAVAEAPTTTTTMTPSLSPATLMMPPPPPATPSDSRRPLRGGGIGSASKPAAAGVAAVALSPATASTTRCLGGEAGVIPRAVSTLLADAEARRAQGWEFALTATYVEIYNERIRDLLNPANDNLQVKESPSSGLHAAGAKEVRVSSLEEAVAVLRGGAEHRATASTLMNNASSRSHSIFMLRLDQRDVVRDCKVSARLTLVDLAGSERAARTGAEGKRLEEANSINVSLHTLGRVIRTLSESGPHVPFRDSKLTRLLQESLGGNSRTVLIICCSPEEEQAQETLSTLKFGECAKRVTTFASANVVAAPDEIGAQLAQLRAEVVRLKRQLHNSQLREAGRNEAMASMGGRRSSRSYMGAGGGGGAMSALRRKWGASPLSRPASFNNATSFASDMVNSSGDESWSAAVSNTRGGGVWEQGESAWTGAGAAGIIATAPSPSTPGWKPVLLAQPQSPLSSLVSPTVSPDAADQAGTRPKQQRGRRQHQHQHQHQQQHQQQHQHQHQQQEQRPRWGSANRTAHGGAGAARSSAKKKSGSTRSRGRNHKRTSSGSSTRTNASARRLWSEGDDERGSTTDTAGSCPRNNKDVKPTTPAPTTPPAETTLVEKVTPAASGGDGVHRCWTRRRSRSGGRSSCSRERAPEQPVSAAEAELEAGGEATAGVGGASGEEAAASGRWQQGQQGEGVAVAAVDGPVGVGSIRKAAEGRGATAGGEEFEGDKEEARDSLRAALDRVQGLETGWAKRVKAYEQLLRLKDLRIESLMLLHNHRQGKTAANGDCGSKLADGGGGGGGGGSAAADSRSASATPTRRKTKGMASSASRKKRSPRDRRSPRSAGTAAEGNLRSGPPRRTAGRGLADPLGGVGKRAAFPAAPPPSPMKPNDKLKHFALEDTDTD